MIEFMQDSQWPGRTRMTIRGSQDIWLTDAELRTIRDQVTYILDHPMALVEKPIKLFQLYDKRGRQ